MISKALTESGFFNPNQINQCLVSELEICQKGTSLPDAPIQIIEAPSLPAPHREDLAKREAEAKKESYRMLVWPRFSSGGSIFVM